MMAVLWVTNGAKDYEGVLNQRKREKSFLVGLLNMIESYQDLIFSLSIHNLNLDQYIGNLKLSNTMQQTLIFASVYRVGRMK